MVPGGGSLNFHVRRHGSREDLPHDSVLLDIRVSDRLILVLDWHDSSNEQSHLIENTT